MVELRALDAKAVMIRRAYLWGLGVAGRASVENMFDIMRAGIDSTLLGLGRASTSELSRGRTCWCRRGFTHAFGVAQQAAVGLSG